MDFIHYLCNNNQTGMKTERIHLVYFSATYTTRKAARAVAERLPGTVEEHDITCGGPDGDVVLAGSGDLLVAAVPVYAGRVPPRAAEGLRRFHANGAPAVAMVVYGNRAYDDALIELCDLLDQGGFKVIGAGAFVARHSIFTSIAAGRPDGADMAAMARFAAGCTSLLKSVSTTSGLSAPRVPGNRPYREATPIPIYPSGSRKKCNHCNLCVSLCPMGAISPNRPSRTDGSLCISCGRCVEICPQHTRCFSGVTYKMAERKITKLCRQRREPECYYAGGQNPPA